MLESSLSGKRSSLCSIKIRQWYLFLCRVEDKQGFIENTILAEHRLLSIIVNRGVIYLFIPRFRRMLWITDMPPDRYPVGLQRQLQGHIAKIWVNRVLFSFVFTFNLWDLIIKLPKFHLVESTKCYNVFSIFLLLD